MEFDDHVTMDTIDTSVLSTTSETNLTLGVPDDLLILAILHGIITLLGIPGNILVIFALCSSRKLQTSTNVFVANLAFTDLVTCLILPIHIYTLLSGKIPPDVVCKLIGGVFCIFFGASVSSLTLIALNRAYLITRPRAKYDRLYSRKNIALMLIFNWVYVTLAVWVPTAFGTGKLGYTERYRVCVQDISHQSNVFYDLLRAVLGTPFLLVAILCYIYIYFVVQKSTTTTIRVFNRHSQLTQQLRKRQIAVTKSLFIIVCVYFICLTPLYASLLQPSFYHHIQWTLELALYNSCVNPFIYGISHPLFRESFTQILFCRSYKGNNPRSPYHVSS